MNATGRLAGIKRDEGRYDDIIGLAHHVSAVHPHMPIGDRAAQFSPFAALTGYDSAIKETSRLTEEHRELDENIKSMMDGKLRIIKERIGERPEVTATCFRPDPQKEGGAYVQFSGTVRKIDEGERAVIMCDGTKILIDELVGLECGLFCLPEDI